MKAGDVVLALLPQADGASKLRPDMGRLLSVQFTMKTMELNDHQRLIEIELDRTLQSYLTEETNRIIAESLDKDASDVEVRSGQALPAIATIEAAEMGY